MLTGLGTTKRSTFHIIANPIVNLDGDEATSDVTWAMVMATEDGRPALGMFGRHRDRLIREEGRWKFLRREGVLDLPTVFPSGLESSRATQ